MAYSYLHLALTLLIASSSVFETNAQIATSCTASMVKTFTPCLSYVTGSSGRGSSPTADCCNSLKSLMSDGVDCACLIVTGNVPVSIPFVNRNLAISLPRMCGTSVPVQCKASGTRLPPPGPALFGPTPAPAGSVPGSQSPEAADAVAPPPPPPPKILDIAPALSPPQISLGPKANPGIRPVVNPNSASISSTISLPYLVLMSFGVMAVGVF